MANYANSTLTASERLLGCVTELRDRLSGKGEEISPEDVLEILRQIEVWAAIARLGVKSGNVGAHSQQDWSV